VPDVPEGNATDIRRFVERKKGAPPRGTIAPHATASGAAT
jgi:hypothetical protein